MKCLRNALAAGLSALAVAAGALLPQGVFWWKDCQLSHRVEMYDSTPVRFYSSRQVTDTLQILAQEHDTRPLAPAYAGMSTEQVSAASQDFLNAIFEFGLFPGDAAAFTRFSATPVLCVVSGMGASFPEDDSQIGPLVSSRLSGIVWDCTLRTSGQACAAVTVDDATGLVTSISCWTGETVDPPASLKEKWERLRTFADSCGAFLADDYGLKNGGVQYGDYPDHAKVSLMSEEREVIWLELTLSAGAFSIQAG